MLSAILRISFALVSVVTIFRIRRLVTWFLNMLFSGQMFCQVSIFCHFKFSSICGTASHAASDLLTGVSSTIKRKDKSLWFILVPDSVLTVPDSFSLQVPLPETRPRLRTFIMSSEVLLQLFYGIPARFKAVIGTHGSSSSSMFISRTFSFSLSSFSIITSAVFAFSDRSMKSFRCQTLAARRLPRPDPVFLWCIQCQFIVIGNLTYTGVLHFEVYAQPVYR